jgi:hypothetical protein
VIPLFVSLGRFFCEDEIGGGVMPG